MSTPESARQRLTEILKHNSVLALSQEETDALERKSEITNIEKFISLILDSTTYDEFVENREKTRTSRGKRTEFLGSVKTSHLVVHLLRILLERGIVDGSQLELDTLAHLENEVARMESENPSKHPRRNWFSIRRQILKEFISGKLGTIRPLATAIIDWIIKRKLKQPEEIEEDEISVQDAEELSDEITDSFRELCFQRIKWYLFESQI